MWGLMPCGAVRWRRAWAPGTLAGCKAGQARGDVAGERKVMVEKGGRCRVSAGLTCYPEVIPRWIAEGAIEHMTFGFVRAANSGRHLAPLADLEGVIAGDTPRIRTPDME